MNLVERVKNILLKPKDEWDVIEREDTAPADLYLRYIIPLAIIGPVASFIGMSLVGISLPFVGTVRTPIVAGLTSAVVSFALTLVAVFILALIIDALAPTFGGQKDSRQALKVAAYSYTPSWLAGILGILPALSLLIILAALYGLYLLYLGLPVLMKSAREKAVAYTAVVVVCAIVLGIVVGAVVGAIGGLGTGMAGVAQVGSESTGNEAVDQLRKMGEQMEAAGKKMEEAQQSGDANAQMAAAAEMMGALAGGGGPQVQPVDHALLKTLLPADLAGLRQEGSASEVSGVAGLSIAKAEASYSDGQGRDVSLTITDLGGAQGLGMLAGWASMEREETTDTGYEKIHRQGGYMVHEEYNHQDKSGSYTVLVGNRFLVEASGYGVDMGALRQGVSRVNLAQLEAMKSASN